MHKHKEKLWMEVFFHSGNSPYACSYCWYMCTLETRKIFCWVIANGLCASASDTRIVGAKGISSHPSCFPLTCWCNVFFCCEFLAVQQAVSCFSNLQELNSSRFIYCLTKKWVPNKCLTDSFLNLNQAGFRRAYYRIFCVRRWKQCLIWKSITSVLKLPLSISENFGTDPLGDVLLRKCLQEDSLLLASAFQRGKAESSDGLHPLLQDFCWMHQANLRSQDE